jgi:hypothetical protein
LIPFIIHADTEFLEESNCLLLRISTSPMPFSMETWVADVLFRSFARPTT